MYAGSTPRRGIVAIVTVLAASSAFLKSSALAMRILGAPAGTTMPTPVLATGVCAAGLELALLFEPCQEFYRRNDHVRRLAALNPFCDLARIGVLHVELVAGCFLEFADHLIQQRMRALGESTRNSAAPTVPPTNIASKNVKIFFFIAIPFSESIKKTAGRSPRAL